MKNRSTYLLLVLFFAGLLGLWMADYARVPTRAQLDGMRTRVLPALRETKPDDLRKVEILGGLEGPIVFERREGNRWQMTSPIVVAADPSMVETLAYNLKELSRRPDSATLEPDLSRYGLDQPDRTIKLWGAATAAPLATLDLGRISLDRRYVRAGGSEGIEVVDVRGLDLTKLPAIKWRDRELFRVPSFEVDALTITGEGRTLKLKRGRGAWHVVEPIRLLASEARVDGLIADLGSLRVLDDTRFVANNVTGDALERYGLKNPALTVTIESGRADRKRIPQILHIGKPVEGKEGVVYARRDDQDDIVIVDQRILRDLKPDANAFRSSKVADIIPARVIQIAVEGADGSSILAARFGNDWTIVSPSEGKGDRQAIQDFLKALDQLQSETYLGSDFLRDAALDKPSLILKLWQARDSRDSSPSVGSDPKGEPALSLRIGRRDVGRKALYLQVDGDPIIQVVPDAAASFLPRNPLAFRDRQVLAVDVDPIEQIKLVGPSRQVKLNAPVFKVGKAGTGLAPLGWWLVEPVEAPADAPSIGQLLRILGNLRADTLVTEKSGSLDKFGLQSPALTVTWSAIPPFSMVPKARKSQQSPDSLSLEDHALLIGASLPDRPSFRYAKLDDSPLIFTLGPDVLGPLDAEWRDHRVMSFDPARVRQIQLEWPDRKLVFIPVDQAGGRRWKLGPDQDAPDFDSGPLQTLVLSASKLTTNRFAQYGGDFPSGIGLSPPQLTVGLEFDDSSPPRSLKIGQVASVGQVFATTESVPRGSIFLAPQAPFLPFLKAPRRSGDLPDNVFEP